MRTFPSRLYIGILSAISMLLIVTALFAQGTSTPHFTATCASVIGSGGFNTQRDNTGRRMETITIRVTDGAGNRLYDNTTLYPLDQNVNLANVTYTYTQVPRYNPITVSLASAAGNGQPSQVLFSATQTCGGLPIYHTGVFIIGDSLSLVPLAVEANLNPNRNPPRPVNPTGLGAINEGYAIVNTDNLSLRSGDGPQYTIIGVIDGGTELVVRGRNSWSTNNLWWFVEVGELRGWVSSEFLVLRGNLTQVPVMPVNGEIIRPTLYVGAVNGVYAQPSFESRYFLCEIAGDRFYFVNGIDTPQPAWYLIETTCDGEAVDAWILLDRGLLRNPANTPLPIRGS